MNVENHPLLRANPELTGKMLTKAMADGIFAQRAQRYAALDAGIQASTASADEQAEHAALATALLDELQKPVATGCCGGCGGGGH